MEIPFLLRCFLIGALGASGCGPLFILTFNRSAVCGFWKGFATGIGASLGDATYFFLGLLGFLSFLSRNGGVMLGLDLVGGIILLVLGTNSLKGMRQVVCVGIECSSGFWASVFKSLSLALFNPLVILFFMAVSMHALPEHVANLPMSNVVISSVCVMAGSLSILTMVSLVASLLGACITAKRYRYISGASGLAFVLFACYLFFDFISRLIVLIKNF